MPNSRAELSSIVSALTDLTDRVSVIAEQNSGADEDLARELFEVERSLTSAQRRLSNAVLR